MAAVCSLLSTGLSHVLIYHHRTFRWELSLAAISYFLVIVFFKHPRDPRDRRRYNFNLVSSLPFISGLGSLIVALNVCGVDIAWDDKKMTSLFIGVAICLCSFAFVEALSKRLLLPYRTLKGRAISPIMGIALFATLMDMSVSIHLLSSESRLEDTHMHTTQILCLVPIYIWASGKGGTMVGGGFNALVAIGEIVGRSACAYLLLRWDWNPCHLLKMLRPVACVSAAMLLSDDGT